MGIWGLKYHRKIGVDRGNAVLRAAATVNLNWLAMMRCAWTGVTCNEVLTKKTPNGHGLSNNAVAAFRECPLIPPTVRTQRDGYAETESDPKPFLDAKKLTKNRKKTCLRRIVGNGCVHDCHHKIELTKTVILKEKLAPNSTWSRWKSWKTPKN